LPEHKNTQNTAYYLASGIELSPENIKPNQTNSKQEKINRLKIRKCIFNSSNNEYTRFWYVSSDIFLNFADTGIYFTGKVPILIMNHPI